MKQRLLSLAPALLLFLISLPLPAYRLAGDRTYPGLPTLLFGPIGLLSVSEWGQHPHKAGYLAWLANPACAVAALLLLVQAPRAAVALSALALLLAPLAALLKSVPMDEGGTRAEVIALGPGFWVWLTALAAVLVAAALQARSQPPAAG